MIKTFNSQGTKESLFRQCPNIISNHDNDLYASQKEIKLVCTLYL